MYRIQQRNNKQITYQSIFEYTDSNKYHKTNSINHE